MVTGTKTHEQQMELTKEVEVCSPLVLDDVDDEVASTVSPRSELAWAGAEAGTGKIIGNRCTACSRLLLPGMKVCPCNKKRAEELLQELRDLTAENYQAVALKVYAVVSGAEENTMETFVEEILRLCSGDLTAQLAEDLCRWTAEEGGLRHSVFRRVLLRRCQAKFEEKLEVCFASFLSELNSRGIMGTRTLRACAERLVMQAVSDLDHVSPLTVSLLEALLSCGQLNREEFSELRQVLVDLKGFTRG